MDTIDSRTLSVDALDERRRRAVKMRLDGVSLKDTVAQCEMSRTTVIAALKAHAEGGWRAVHHAPRPSRKHGAHADGQTGARSAALVEVHIFGQESAR
ncbi:hypothetical protein Veis_3761 [Verminephrobacter eiseniae EF01-2]|uniref:Uncharacterized protein n=1 Tax=Verminephrobacter eiseniae (strain EF01-2) TaxID=391735 RepID=A1WPB6_VEREI|nr:hypothetical protein Veis_3761 [Verminephrobacter eiseniae EF01-2]MCW5284998.1 helix-turn-helix domain-containing protein [Verminephrobacter eiseniae]MCW5302706.1 helix-turn-helix domain-containing protein [Verminephrobacter eiseniae]MCW8178235.1 helix-turn-helix domain-containing protein [Verminephrobacter eiseniae]MCW8188965.1 helix-turn-helix domain-containing protein [Verminephrobacter eiseniae]